MAIKIGTIDVTGVAVGETLVGYVAVGSDIVWQRVLPDPLCFTNVQNTPSGVRMRKVGTPDAATIEYSTDGTTWTEYTFPDSDIILDNQGDKVYFRASGTNDISFNKDGNNYYRFDTTMGMGPGFSKLNVSGNINTLFKKDGSIGVRGKSRCFRDLFNGCDIVDASQLELPSTTLALQCYYGMFQDNTFLSAAPALPSTALASSCYRSMFRGCTSLKSAPALPVTSLNEYCYHQMFYGCTSLTDAPELPATTLASNCYGNMFQGCSSLSSITVGFSDWQAAKTPTSNWVNGVASTGEFYCPSELSVVRGASNIPTNWVVNPADAPWLCFTAEEANSTVMMRAIGSAPTVSLECSTDGSTWSPFVVGTTTVTLANIGDKVYVRATIAGNTGMGTSSSNYNMFVMIGKIAASGNVDTLLDQNGNATLTNYCYTHLFENCPLTTAPELPATTLAEGCYYSMLYRCSSLTTAPELPATTLATYCYNGMFRECTSLTTAPELPATTLANSCYRNMFRGCSSLNSITLGYTGNFADAPTNAFDRWVDGVAASGTFYYNGSDTTRGPGAIPENWTVTPYTP